jgi:hypothetical protein
MLILFLSVALQMKDIYFKAVLHCRKPCSNIFAELWSVTLLEQAF